MKVRLPRFQQEETSGGDDDNIVTAYATNATAGDDNVNDGAKKRGKRAGLWPTYVMNSLFAIV
jgi:hypothetical protein